MKRFILSALILAAILLAGIIAVDAVDLGIAVASSWNPLGADDTPRTLTAAPSRLTPLSDETKAKIIELIYRDPSMFKYVVGDDRKLYLMVPASIFSRLPKQINGVTLQKVTTDDITKDFHHAYVEFNRWDERKKTIYVDDAAHFWGGNGAGCSRRFERTGDTFRELTPSCGAYAS